MSHLLWVKLRFREADTPLTETHPSVFCVSPYTMRHVCVSGGDVNPDTRSAVRAETSPVID